MCGSYAHTHTNIIIDNLSFPFLGKMPIKKIIYLYIPVRFISDVCLEKAGRREQLQLRQIHCTVTYFIVLFLEGNKTLPAFLMYSVKL